MNNNKIKTVVISASAKHFRYSNSAVVELKRNDYPVEAIGLRNGFIEDIEIQTRQPSIADTDTVSIYVAPGNQLGFYNYIVNVLKPRRIILNPGTENNEFESLAMKYGIEVVRDCTLKMLALGTY